MTLTASTSTQAVVNHHLASFFARDLQGVVADYAPDAVLIVPTGVLRGAHEMTPLFQGLFAEFAKPGATFDLQQQVIEDDVAYIRWVAETPDNTYQLGTDTFFVRHGKIRVQTFAFKATPKA
jgi:ketosteroid isomerase-like protein